MVKQQLNKYQIDFDIQKNVDMNMLFKHQKTVNPYNTHNNHRWNDDGKQEYYEDGSSFYYIIYPEDNVVVKYGYEKNLEKTNKSKLWTVTYIRDDDVFLKNQKPPYDFGDDTKYEKVEMAFRDDILIVYSIMRKEYNNTGLMTRKTKIFDNSQLHLNGEESYVDICEIDYDIRGKIISVKSKYINLKLKWDKDECIEYQDGFGNIWNKEMNIPLPFPLPQLNSAANVYLC
jgi:hypothetical protein